MIRTPIVSGQFYPSSREKLLAQIESLGKVNGQRTHAKGIILPHAGYTYSGRVAVATVKGIIAKKTVILLGPNHSGCGHTFAVWAKGAWETPLGSIAVNENLAASILANTVGIKEDYSAHKYEHSIEVELPILQKFFGDFSLVPIACKTASLNDYEAIAEGLARTLKPYINDILIVASSDLSHYEPEQTARLKDRLAIEAMINLDERQLIDTVSSNNITMCGLAPVAIALSCLRKLGAVKAQIALYETSAQAGGDSASVVGYAGIIIS